MAPFLPPVRSLAHISNPAASRNRGPAFPPNFRIPAAAIHAISPDLLPVSPFLLSPSPLGVASGGNANNRDSSRSPFFIQQGSAATSPSESPVLSMHSLSQASIEANIDPQTQFLASQSVCPPSPLLIITPTLFLSRIRFFFSVTSFVPPNLRPFVTLPATV